MISVLPRTQKQEMELSTCSFGIHVEGEVITWLMKPSTL
jgi:hypothetical protein